MNNVQSRIKEKGTPLIGMAVYNNNPAFVEMLGLLGYDIVWIEMEHAHLTFPEVLNLCRIGSGVGLLTMIRISDTRRENVLKAAECGADIIDLPMGNHPEQLRELVSHARYAPEGDRGFFLASRATRYGIVDSLTEERSRINRSLCLFAQIETRQAVECADELCSVSGLDGIFIGPGDLSASLGIPGDIADPEVRKAIDRSIAAAKKQGKLVAITAGHPEALALADIVFPGSDISCMRSGAQNVIKSFKDTLHKKA